MMTHVMDTLVPLGCGFAGGVILAMMIAEHHLSKLKEDFQRLVDNYRRLKYLDDRIDQLRSDIELLEKITGHKSKMKDRE